MHIRPHEKLLAWQEAYRLSLIIYRYTQTFPSYELYGMTAQLRRAAVSVPLNIAEGNTKSSRKERRHFFEISLASLEESHCCSRLAHDLEYLSRERFEDINARVQAASKLIFSLIRSLQ